MRTWVVCEADGRPYFLGPRMVDPGQHVPCVELEPVLGLLERGYNSLRLDERKDTWAVEVASLLKAHGRLP